MDQFKALIAEYPKATIGVLFYVIGSVVGFLFGLRF